MKFNLLDRILFHLFKNYTYKIYKIGMKDGFLWHNCTLTVQQNLTNSKKPLK